jgi:hypothetical protein
MVVLVAVVVSSRLVMRLRPFLVVLRSLLSREVETRLVQPSEEPLGFTSSSANETPGFSIAPSQSISTSSDAATAVAFAWPRPV